MLEHIDVKIEGGRDSGKVFRITEMPATKAEWWAVRVIGLIMEGDKDGKLIELAGLGGFEMIASVGIAQVIRSIFTADPERVRPLWDELTECWEIVFDPSTGSTRKLVEDDIREVSTLAKLRIETLKLHLDFFTKSTQTMT